MKDTDVNLFISGLYFDRLEKVLEDSIAYEFKDIGDVRVIVTPKNINITLLDSPDRLNDVKNFVLKLISNPPKIS